MSLFIDVVEMSKLKISSKKSIWQTKIPAECSYVWIGILQVRYIANHIIRYQIGDGTRVSLWYNPWLADGPRRSRFEERVRLAASIRDNYSVSALIVDGKWDLPQTRCAGVVNIRQEIRTIDLPPCVIEDRAVWTLTPDGNFYLRSAGDFVRNKDFQPVYADIMWHAENIPRHSVSA